MPPASSSTVWLPADGAAGAAATDGAAGAAASDGAGRTPGHGPTVRRDRRGWLRSVRQSASAASGAPLPDRPDAALAVPRVPAGPSRRERAACGQRDGAEGVLSGVADRRRRAPNGAVKYKMQGARVKRLSTYRGIRGRQPTSPIP